MIFGATNEILYEDFFKLILSLNLKIQNINAKNFLTTTSILFMSCVTIICLQSLLRFYNLIYVFKTNIKIINMIFIIWFKFQSEMKIDKFKKKNNVGQNCH